MEFNIGHIHVFSFLFYYYTKTKRAEQDLRELRGFGTKWRWKKATCRPLILESELSSGCSYCSSVALSRRQKQEHHCICMHVCVSSIHSIQALSDSVCGCYHLFQCKGKEVKDMWSPTEGDCLIHRLVGFKEAWCFGCVFFFFAHLFIMHNGPIHKSHAKEWNAAIFA